MTEAANGADQQQTQVKMQILGQFIRDMSFENILVQKGLTASVQPDVQVQVSLDARKRPTDHQYEVFSKFNVTSRNKETNEVYFALEIDYGGLFHIEGVPDQQLHPFLMIECPRMMFPYVRRIVSDITRDGGFPPLFLDNVDFMTIYRQEIERRAKAQA
ncbi:MAG: protein-export chaperone SecB [Rhodobacteraceae bacterium]|nr:protein-export chaperone SecB [Paracoccaceae bacterium]